MPGFVTDTRLEPGARVVTFAHGKTVREPIVSLDDETRRLVWSVEGLPTTHFNGAAQLMDEQAATRVVWIAAFLPHTMTCEIEAAMAAGVEAMQVALDRLANSA